MSGPIARIIRRACAPVAVAAMTAVAAAAQQAPAGGAVTTGEVPGVPCGAQPACTTSVRSSPQTCGRITAANGSVWSVPSAVFNGPVAVDVYNDCTGPGDNPAHLSELKTVVIDPDGVEITGYVFADNYYELYVNGTFVARDRMAMTPFNSTVVRFRAKYPITYAIKAVDWETHHGLGLEYEQYNVGDGGFIAKFSDGTTTGADWKVETFYVAPLSDPACVTVTAAGRDSTGCPSQKTAGGNKTPCALSDPKSCKALHFPIPDNWASPRFNDAAWPRATLYTAEEVTGAPGYVKYAQLFESARFIWTKNLLLDNLVLARYTAAGPRR